MKTGNRRDRHAFRSLARSGVRPWTLPLRGREAALSSRALPAALTVATLLLTSVAVTILGGAETGGALRSSSVPAPSAPGSPGPRPAGSLDPGAEISIAPPSSPVGWYVNASGGGFVPDSTLYLNFSSIAVLSCRTGGLESNDSGNFSCVFQVPTLPAGSYPVNVSDGVNLATVSFTIEPPTLVLTPTSGPVGTDVTAMGMGFAPSALLVLVAAGVPQSSCVSGSLTSDAGGNLSSCEFAFPTVHAGDQDVTLNDSVNSSLATFDVESPSLSLAPATGPVGTSTVASGAGYAHSVDLTLDYSGAAVTCTSGSTESSDTGSFSCTFTVPASTSGGHTVRASDLVNSATATFSVTAELTLTPHAGNVSALVVAAGSGFGSGQSVSVNWNASRVGVCVTTTESSGSFSCTFPVPPSPAGIHTVTAVNGTNAPTANFDVDPNASLSPTVGNVTQTVDLTATGFDASASITISWDDSIALCAGTTDTNGGFSCSFEVPASPVGSHSVSVVQGSHTVTKAFQVTTTLAIAPTSGPKGTPVSLSGAGFGASTTYLVCFEATVTPCPDGSPTFVSEANGSVPSGTSVEVPSLAAGSYDVDISTGSTVAANATFLVTPASLVVAPISGPVASNLGLSGAGYLADTGYFYCLQSTQALCPSGTTTEFDSTGAGAIPSGTTLTVPNTPGGAYFVDVSEGSDLLATTSFTVVAAVAGNTSSATVGTTVVASGTGFDADTAYAVDWNATLELCHGTTNGAGAFSCSFPVPTAVAGPHTVTAKEGSNAPGFSLAVVPFVTVTPQEGAVGSTVTVTGSGFDASAAVAVVWDSVQTVCAPTSGAAGELGCTFAVPPAVAGPNTLTAHEGAYAPATSFAVLPSLSLTPTSGTVGSAVVVTGDGFAASAAYEVTWNLTTELCEGIANGTGAFVCPFNVPASVSNTVTIVAVESESGDTASVEFTVVPGLTVAPDAGAVGASAVAEGTGYSGGVSFSFSWNRSDVLCGGTTSSLGAFSCDFTVPTATAGLHILTATVSGQGFPIDFTVVPNVVLAEGNGTVGGAVSLHGSGFDADASFYLSWNSSTVACTGTSTSDGNVSCTFAVPNGPGGSHALTFAEGAYALTVGFTVLASISVTPTTAVPGATVTFAGSGFGAGANYQVTFNGTTLLCSGTTDTNGAFVCSFAVPSATPGNYTIRATQGPNAPTLLFVVAAAPPPPPASSGTILPWWVVAALVVAAVVVLLVVFVFTGRRRAPKRVAVHPWEETPPSAGPSGGAPAPAGPTPVPTVIGTRPPTPSPAVAAPPPSAVADAGAPSVPAEPEEDIDAMLHRLERIAEEVFKRKPQVDLENEEATAGGAP